MHQSIKYDIPRSSGYLHLLIGALGNNIWQPSHSKISVNDLYLSNNYPTNKYDTRPKYQRCTPTQEWHNY